MTGARRAAAGAAVALLAVPAGHARAGGFLIYEQGPSALGQAGAFVARADDPSAIFYNPAGLAAHPRLGVLAGVTAIISSTTASRLQPAGTSSSSETRVFFPPTLYAAVPLPVLDGRVVAGLGAFTQYGLGMTWPADWPGRYQITGADARSINVNPTLSVRVLPRLWVGAGMSVVYAVLELRRAVDLTQEDGRIHMGGTATAFGGNGGLLWEAIPDRLRLGLAYRSATHLRVDDGRADFTVPPEFSQQLRDQRVRSVIRTPHLVTAAASVRTAGQLRLSIDVVYATWSSFEWFYFRFPDSSPEADLSTFERQDWNNTVSVRAGGELPIAEHWRVRGGLGYDPSPVPRDTLSPVIPDAARTYVSAGVSRDLGPVRAELSYMLALFSDRSSGLAAFPARYATTGHLIGAALQYRRP